MHLTWTALSVVAKIKCPHGEPAKDPSTLDYIVCSGQGNDAATSCPADYFCHFDGTRHGCCPTKSKHTEDYRATFSTGCINILAKTCTIDQPDAGTTCILSPIARWYYNTQTRMCDTFTYNGCDGNSNNFAAKIDCQDYCAIGGIAISTYLPNPLLCEHIFFFRLPRRG